MGGWRGKTISNIKSELCRMLDGDRTIKKKKPRRVRWTGSWGRGRQQGQMPFCKVVRCSKPYAGDS